MEQNLRRQLQEAEEELTRTRQELDEKSQQLRQLRQALPLPEPERLYENIIKLCHNFNSCTTRVTELNNRINALRRSSDSYDNRLHNVELLELSVENLRIEMTFTRFQLRTLFTIPALLCAAGNTTKDIWDAWMDRPHRNDMGLPLLVQPDQIEMVATDQLQQLTHHHQSLMEIRTSLMEEDRETAFDFRKQMSEAVAKLQSSLDSALLAKDLQEQAQQPPLGPEGIAMHDQEREAIQENVEFLEGVELEEAEANEEEEPPNLRERLREEDGNRREYIQQELQQLKQARDNLRLIIDELRQHPTCPPRRYGYGAISNNAERLMRCAFCRSVGRHYSDSCDEITSVTERRQMIEDRDRCVECLENCKGRQLCPKYYARCFHCGEFDHHSALCELPDRSEEVAERLARARRSLEDTYQRIEFLEHEMRLLHN
ncbi:hypothetical protein COOONC_15932 [Cooperia oncophora]